MSHISHMVMASGTFGTAVNCMDGRVQRPIADWVTVNHGVQFVDMVTEAGPDSILAHGPAHLVEHIRQRVLVSTGPHGSKVVVVAGHSGCAGNPVPDDPTSSTAPMSGPPCGRSPRGACRSRSLASSSTSSAPSRSSGDWMRQAVR